MKKSAILLSSLVSFSLFAGQQPAKPSSIAPSPQKPQENTWGGSRLPIHMEGWFGDLEFLWWKADEAGLDYVVEKDFRVFSSSAILDGAQLDGLAGKMHHAGFSWDPGVRAQLGYRFNKDAWELFGAFTWLHTDQTRTVTRPAGTYGVLAGTFPEYTVTPVTKAHSAIDLRYKIADLCLARRFAVSRDILLRLVFGPKAGWIRENWDVKYYSTSNLTKHEIDWSFKGFGLQLGLGLDWYLGAGFSLFGNAAASALYGTHHDHLSSYSQTLDPTDPLQRASCKDHRTVRGTQLAGGLSWGRAWEEWSLKIFAAWEMNSWFNLAEHYRSSTGLVPADKNRSLTTSVLSLEGLTAGVSINF